MKNNTEKRLALGITVILILSLCLGITTFALVYATVSVENNLFRTGKVAVNLNDGKAIISEDDFIFEPGMTVTKEFFIENESTWEIYYRLYFDNVSGGLADVLEITVSDGDGVLYQGKATELTRQNTAAADDKLAASEVKELTITFHYLEESENSTRNLSISFDFCADAVQTKNNPDKLFD